MRRFLIVLALIPSVVFGESQGWMERAKSRGRDMFPSIGLTYFRNPMHADNFAVDDKQITADAFLPLTPIFTWTASYGLREQAWRTGSSPIIYKGPTYSFGVRLYWAPG